MTTDKRDQQSEPEFEQDLEVVRSAWLGEEKAEPPELLDQAVLNAAQRELDARRKSRPLRWLGGFATATVVVLALTIVIQQDQQSAPGKTDDFMLDQAAPVALKKESERDDREEMAAPGQAAGQLMPESGQRTEFRAQRSAAPQADPASNAATATVAEEIAIAPAEPEKGANRIPEAEAWIERLVLLRETQQDEKLVEELAAFREAYPDYPLPPELE